MNGFPWLIRREVWESRGLWLIPTVTAGVIILAALFTQAGHVELDSGVEVTQLCRYFLLIAGGIFFALVLLYSSWYFTDSLHNDRRDRSILFWKSLPISDTATVLSKLTVGLLLAPLVYFAIADVTALLTAFVLSIRFHSMLGASLWQGNLWLQAQVLWLYVILTSAIWFLPVSGWILLVSAWANRAVLLWSILPLVAGTFLEHWIVGSDYLLGVIKVRLFGYFAFALHGEYLENEATIGAKSIWPLMDAGGFFTSPQTWIGLAVGAALIVAAIQMRMRRVEI